MFEVIIVWLIGFVAGLLAIVGLGYQWLIAKPARLKAAVRGIVDALASHHQGDNFEVWGTLVIGEKNALAVNVFVSPHEMADAIATYALRDDDVSRTRRIPDDDRTCKKGPSAEPETLRDLSHKPRS